MVQLRLSIVLTVAFCILSVTFTLNYWCIIVDLIRFSSSLKCLRLPHVKIYNRLNSLGPKRSLISGNLKSVPSSLSVNGALVPAAVHRGQSGGLLVGISLYLPSTAHVMYCSRSWQSGLWVLDCQWRIYSKKN